MGSIGTDLLGSDVYPDQTTSPVTTSTTAKQAANVAVQEIKISDKDIENQKKQSDEDAILYTKLTKRPPKIVSSKGNFLHTEDGKHIFDATGGAAVACLGHNDVRVNAAVARQMESVAYCYAPFFTTDVAEQLAKKLTASSGGEFKRVFVVSSGTEAIEAALKMARQYYTELPQPQLQRVNFIARKQSYHGNTLGSLSVGYHVGRRAIYESILGKNVAHVSPCYPYRGMLPGESNDEYVHRLAQELEDTFQHLGPDTVCAFVAETMAGLTLGGVPPVPGYLTAMKAVCDRHGALFILDEVLCGMGRTGTMHAWQQEGVVPDMQTVAKGLGAGYIPIGALLVGRKVVDVLGRGTGIFIHSQTYQGHPVACAAALEVQRIIEEGNLLQNVQAMGEKLGAALKRELQSHKNVGDIRGRGLAWGIELVKNKETKEPFPAQEQVAGRLHLSGLTSEAAISVLPGQGMADGVNGDVIMVAPAYNITEAEIETIVTRVNQVIRSVLG